MTDPAPFGTGGFTTTRLLAASRERVWREWTEPACFADWFGGVECEVPLSTVTMDVRPGGAWRATMYCGPARREIRWRGRYHEVTAPERLIFTITSQPDDDHDELVRVDLTDLGDGRTEMRLEQRGRMPPDEYEHTKEGWDVFFARLDERLSG
jgi:uncharacterized protein YndB with AHSA1/START domain